MYSNLISAARSYFTHEVEGKIGSHLGESSEGISRAIDCLIPTVFTGLADNSITPDGAERIERLVAEQGDNALLENPSLFFMNGKAVSTGGLLSGTFGNNEGMLGNLVSNFSGIKTASAYRLHDMVTAFILSLIGKHAASANLNANGIASLLSNQRPYIAQAMPPGVNLDQIFGHTPELSKPIEGETTGHSAVVKDEHPGPIKWLVPILLMGLLGASALYFYKNDARVHEQTVPAKTDTAKVVTRKVVSTTEPTVATASPGRVDSFGNFIYNTGNSITLELPNAAGELIVGENSTEAKLARFLQSNEPLDTVKGNWFDFTHVRFQTGSAVIMPESIVQLKSLVMIAKAFPSARFKIGGYTDNTGDAVKNLALSKGRATAVATALKSLGVPQRSLTGSDGYGDKFPVADNATAEGRSQNRRVAVNVKAK